MLHIYNTLTKTKEIFKPLNPPKVGLYVCGITVYDYPHIGHARTYLVFDMVLRYLRYNGYDVRYVRNITDIDDKIIKRANQNNEPYTALTERFITAMHEDFKNLNIIPPDLEPRATDYIPGINHMIGELIKKDHAYQASNGDVYYNVQSFAEYGCLAHRNLEELDSGARIDINEAKQNPLDFVIWKMAKPGEPNWDSPWGVGRPGWHIECSVMSLDNLGLTFDLHGGGQDLKFPHHENERALSEATTNQTFVNTWMHVGFVQIDKEKMSKSLNNFLTIRDFLKKYDPELLRYFTLSSHYRSPVDYADDLIEAAASALERLYTALRGLPEPVCKTQNAKIEPTPQTEFEMRFKKAMDDDFNTPVALSVLFDLAREINKEKNSDKQQAAQLGHLLKKLGNVLGILERSPDSFLQGLNAANKAALPPAEIEQLIEQRITAKKAKNWSEADKIRNDLLLKGIILEDTATGTLWRQG